MTDRQARFARRKGQQLEQVARKDAEAQHLAQLEANSTPELRAHHAAELQAMGAAGRLLQRDPLAVLFNDGRLRREQLRAGHEIQRVYQVISAGIVGRTVASYGERMPTGTAGEDWPPALAAAYRDRYGPWRAWAAQQGIRAGSWGRRTSRHTLADLTLCLVVDGRGPKQVGRQMGADSRTVVSRLQQSLAWYAVHAGWLPEAVGLVAAELHAAAAAHG